tara:strand:+ start:491 stop:1492 length:1002 start_codon:yes stop_codon:yes gene_type:complete
MVAAVPVVPVSPFGIAKSKVAALEEPLFATLAELPAAPVVVEPTAIVAADPVAPVEPVAPVAPTGIPKLKVAAEDDPLFVTVGEAPTVRPVAVPAAIVAAVPVEPVEPVAPVAPTGMPKLKVAAEDDPLFVTVGAAPTVRPVAVPAAIVAAVPVVPVEPVAPVSPRGIVKLNVAADDEPPLTMAALLPAAPVVTVPTAIVAAVPVVPVSPFGIAKFKVAAEDEPTFVTVADDPAAPVVVEPTVTVAAEPAAPVDPVLPVAPSSPCGIVNDKTPPDVIETAALLPAAPVVTVPIDGSTPIDCVDRCMTSTLPVPLGGAAENVSVVPLTAYVSFC